MSIDINRLMFEAMGGAEMEAQLVAGPMDAEQQQVAHDLIAHALDKVSKVIGDFIQLSDHPAQTYIMLMHLGQLIINGFAVYHPVAGIDKHGRLPPPTTPLDRVRYSTAVLFLMCADQRGHKEAGKLIKKCIRHDVDGRELWRFISQMTFDHEEAT